MAKVTLSDIAKDLGVSKALISFVLNGRGDKMRISAKLQAKVKQRAKELGYKPNQLARGLRKGKTETLGLVIPDISNPFFAEITRAVENEAKKHGYNVIFCSSDESTKSSKESVELLRNRQVDGLIIVPTYNFLSEINKLKEENFPFVLIDRYFNRLNANSVVIDNYSASMQAIEHLIKLGHKRIGCISFLPDFLHIQDRVEGYKDAIEKHGLKLDPKLIRNVPYDNMDKDVEKIMKEFTTGKNKVDALYLAANVIGMSSIQAFNHLGVKIPDDISIICFDDPEALKLSPVPITTIRQPIAEIGLKAVQILIEDIKTGKSKDNIFHNVQLAAKLIVRKSCGNKN
jgi:LacI family transcriptional regulator